MITVLVIIWYADGNEKETESRDIRKSGSWKSKEAQALVLTSLPNSWVSFPNLLENKR